MEAFSLAHEGSRQPTKQTKQTKLIKCTKHTKLHK